MEKCYCDWGEHGGDWCMCLGFFSGNMECCEPCCGKPCNTSDGVYCCLSWFPGCCFAGPKCLAGSQNQECAIINHGVPFILLLIFIIPIIGLLGYVVLFTIETAIRFNLRKMHGIGETSKCDPCDCCAVWFIIPGPCMACQEMRSVPKEHWDWWASFNEKKFPGSESKIEPCYTLLCVE